MQNLDVKTVFTEIVRRALGDESLVLNDATTARDVAGWDSLKQIMIITEVEERFDITLHSRDVDKITCVGNFVSLIQQKVG
jgi:acyl carrier protein